MSDQEPEHDLPAGRPRRGNLKGVRSSAPTAPHAPSLPEALKPPEKKLTAKELAFVEVYCGTLNASRSAREAGYSPTSARVIGQTMVKKPHIAAAIQARLTALGKSNPHFQMNVMRTLNLCLEVTPFDFLDEAGDPLRPEDIDPEAKAALSSWTVKKYECDGFTKDVTSETVTIKLHNKGTVAALLAKLLGMGEMEDAEAKQNQAIKDAGPGLRGKLAMLTEHRRKRALAQSNVPGGASPP